MNDSIEFDNQKKVKEIPMVDIAYEIFKQTKKNYYFNDLVKEIASVKDLSEEEIQNYIAQLFTEVNIDGRFVHLGKNEWGLKSWFPIDLTDSLHVSKDDEDYDDEEYEDEDDEDEVEDEVEDVDEEESDDDYSDGDFDAEFNTEDEVIFEDEDLDNEELMDEEPDEETEEQEDN